MSLQFPLARVKGFSAFQVFNITHKWFPVSPPFSPSFGMLKTVRVFLQTARNPEILHVYICFISVRDPENLM